MMGDKKKKGKGKKSRDGSEIQVKMPPTYPSTDVSLLLTPNLGTCISTTDLLTTLFMLKNIHSCSQDRHMLYDMNENA